MAYLRATGRVGVAVERAADMARDPALLRRCFDGVTAAGPRWIVEFGKHHHAIGAVVVSTNDSHVLRWRSVSGPRHCGAVHFRPDGRWTVIVVELAWDTDEAPSRRAVRRRVRAMIRDFRFEAERLPRPGPTPRAPERVPVLDPADAAPGTSGTPFGPLFPFTDPDDRT